MKAGDIALAQLQQANGQHKLRPVLLLKQLPPLAIGRYVASALKSGRPFPILMN